MTGGRLLIPLMLSMALSISIMSLLLLPSVQAQQNSSASNSSTSSNATTTPGLIHEPDASPEAAVIIIKRDNASDRLVFEPNSVTIRAGEEILIFSNDTSPQSLTSGNGPNDPAAGNIFDTDLIEPGGLIEYTSSNVQDGQQIAFFSKADPSARGTLLISGVIPEFGALSAIILAVAITGTIVVIRMTAGKGMPSKS